jgi:hypothetical protein
VAIPIAGNIFLLIRQSNALIDRKVCGDVIWKKIYIMSGEAYKKTSGVEDQFRIRSGEGRLHTIVIDERTGEIVRGRCRRHVDSRTKPLKSILINYIMRQ